MDYSIKPDTNQQMQPDGQAQIANPNCSLPLMDYSIKPYSNQQMQPDEQAQIANPNCSLPLMDYSIKPYSNQQMQPDGQAQIANPDNCKKQDSEAQTDPEVELIIFDCHICGGYTHWVGSQNPEPFVLLVLIWECTGLYSPYLVDLPHVR